MILVMDVRQCTVLLRLNSRKCSMIQGMIGRCHVSDPPNVQSARLKIARNMLKKVLKFNFNNKIYFRAFQKTY